VQQPPAHPPQEPGSYAPVRPTNSLAIVSLVTGIASYAVIPLVGAIVAVVTGHMARGQIKTTGEGGSGMALAGLILGYLHLVLFAIAVVIGLILLVLFVVFGITILNGTLTPANTP
jgi:hypothetical protein